MCGLAGYNCAPGWAQDHITETEQAEILKLGWRYNQHRGTDAVGYFAVNTENNKTVFQKWGLSAKEVIELMDEKNIHKMTRAHVLGAHTRAATLGAPSNPGNNHPVIWDGVYVTHNGHISNHDKLKSVVKPAKRRKAVPEVDSAAIPVVLSQIQNPWDFKALCEALQEFAGGMAIHAIWEDHPGVSLLARSTGSPLIVRYNSQGCMVYGSEEESAWEIAAVMGDPNSVDWTVQDLDENTAMLFHEGVPIEWAKWKKTTYGNHGNVLTTRNLIRRPKKTKKDAFVYQTDITSDFANKAGGSIRCLEDNSLDDLEIIYTAEEGFSDKDESWPMSQDNDIMSRCSEADTVYYNRKVDMYYAVFGDLELVLDKWGGVKDVYNYALSTDDRFSELKISELLNDKDTVDAFFKKHARVPFLPISRHSEPKFERGRTSVTTPKALTPTKEEEKKTETTTSPSQQTMLPLKNGTSGGTITTQDIGKVPKGKRVDIKSALPVKWDNITKVVQQHPSKDFVFFEDTVCRTHDLLYSKHTDPENCELMLVANAIVLSSITDIMMYILLMPDKYKEVTYLADSKCEKMSCEWYINNERAIVFPEKQVWIPTGDKCRKCGARRKLNGIPHYYRDQMVGERRVAIGAERWITVPGGNPLEVVGG